MELRPQFMFDINVPPVNSKVGYHVMLILNE